MNVPLGRLERVDLRAVWVNEAGDFIPWLAQEENVELLGETLGLDLEVEAQEKNVGPFRADILCKDTATGAWVPIENQLERTDHSHLGQLLTYAAGLEAVTIVWVARAFTEEHRATLDWLNEISDERFNFFGLEVEVWRIGEFDARPEVQHRQQAERVDEAGVAGRECHGRRAHAGETVPGGVLDRVPRLHARMRHVHQDDEGAAAGLDEHPA